MKEKSKALDIKRGYLKSDFKFFHLKDKKDLSFEPHYHDFNKINIFISGNVTYLIEGRIYKLRPWDILFVSSNEMHKPLIDPSEVYERIIIWVNPAFIRKHNSEKYDLLTCFQLAFSQRRNLMRLKPEQLGDIKHTLSKLEDACKDKEFGNQILKNALLLQLIIYLNRLFSRTKDINEQREIVYHENIAEVLNYINENLKEKLTIDSISSRFFMSKYYLMHKFKKQTGYTIHNYILQKRLMMANTLVKRGEPIGEVYLECGFGDYSNFIRAFKKMFGMPPKKYYKALMELEKSYGEEKH